MKFLNRVNYYFIGPSGAGKSFLGPRVAQALGLEFLDSDKAIEAHTGHRTDELLDLFGEERLRSCETAFLDNHPRSGHVVACGAGMVLAAGFLQKLAQPHVLAFLEASLDTLVKRIEAQTDQRRSLLEGPPGLSARLQALMEERRGVYAQSWPLRLQTDAAPVDELVQQLCAHYWACRS